MSKTTVGAGALGSPAVDGRADTRVTERLERLALLAGKATKILDDSADPFGAFQRALDQRLDIRGDRVDLRPLRSASSD
jgi:hypothetical protein